MKRPSQYLRARGGRAVVIGPVPGGWRGVIARGGAAGRAAPARRRSGRRAGSSGQRSAPKQAGRGGDLAGAARRRAALAAAGGQCAGGAVWRGGLLLYAGIGQAGRAALAWYAAGRAAGSSGQCRRCGGRWLLQAVQYERPAQAGQKEKGRAAARCASVVPAFSAVVVAPVQGRFCRLPEGSDSSLNGISLQW